MKDALLRSLVRESKAVVKVATGKKAPDLRQCHQYALFFAPLRNHGWILFFMFLTFGLLSAVMTQLARSQIPQPPVENTPPTTSTVEVPQTTPVEATVEEPTSIPAPGVDDEDLESPPPYQPSPSVTPPASTSPAKTSQAQPSSAHLFVVGTACMLTSLASLFFLALTIQAILFCVWGPLNDTPTSVIYWGLFALPAIFSMLGVGSWAVLFRDLFGPKVAKRWPFSEYVLWMGAAMLVMAPFVVVGVVGMLIGKKAIAAVEACQRWCCSDALEAEDAAERAEAPVELQHMGVMEAGAEEGSGSRDEERVGLIAGAEK